MAKQEFIRKIKNNVFVRKMRNIVLKLKSNKTWLKKFMVFGTTLSASVWGYRIVAFAEGVKATVDVRDVFDPIIKILADFGVPLASIMFIVGGLMIMTGRKTKGMDIIKCATIGFLGLQFVPAMLKILASVGDALAQSVSKM